MDSNVSERRSRINTENNYKVTVDELDKKCGQYERSIKRLWEYILNIEKLHGLEIEQMKVKLNCQCGGTGLKQSTSVHDNAGQRAVPIGVTRSQSRPAGQLGQTQQPGIREPAPTPQDQLAPRDLIRSARAQTPTISEMLSDSNVPGNNSDNVNNSCNRPEVNSNRNYSCMNSQDDDIPCAQPQRDAASNTSNLESYGTAGTTAAANPGRTSSSHASSAVGMQMPVGIGNNGGSVQNGIAHSTPVQRQTARNNENRTNGTTGLSNPTFSDVVMAPGNWQQVTHRKRTDNRPPENSEGNTSLAGLRPKKSGDLYIGNIRRRPGDRLKDVADRVRRHAYQNGLRIMAARVIVLRHCDDVVGCKIAVPI